jgi:hypothetical protein
MSQPEKCKWCGARLEEQKSPPGLFYWYECLTTYGTETDDPPVWDRSNECYERELAQQVVLLREAGELIESLDKIKKKCGGGLYIEYCLGSAVFELLPKAQALLTRIKEHLTP